MEEEVCRYNNGVTVCLHTGAAWDKAVVAFLNDRLGIKSLLFKSHALRFLSYVYKTWRALRRKARCCTVTRTRTVVTAIICARSVIHPFAMLKAGRKCCFTQQNLFVGNSFSVFPFLSVSTCFSLSVY